jgi:hypothetical protein
LSPSRKIGQTPDDAGGEIAFTDCRRRVMISFGGERRDDADGRSAI